MSRNVFLHEYLQSYQDNNMKFILTEKIHVDISWEKDYVLFKQGLESLAYFAQTRKCLHDCLPNMMPLVLFKCALINLLLPSSILIAYEYHLTLVLFINLMFTENIIGKWRSSSKFSWLPQRDMKFSDVFNKDVLSR
jgi:hypothetical protein